MNTKARPIFSGDYSYDMWDTINSSKTVDDLKFALYTVCCRLQELETRVSPALKHSKPLPFQTYCAWPTPRCKSP